MKIKTPDYVISEYGCPKLDINNNSYSKSQLNSSCEKLKMHRSACCNNLCGNNYNNNNNYSIYNNNSTCKLGKLVADKSRRLLPHRETLTEYYTRLLHVNYNNNNNNNNNKIHTRDYEGTTSTCLALPLSSSSSSRHVVFSAQQQKQNKNKQNELIKQQRDMFKNNFTNNNNRYNGTNLFNRNTTPTPNAYLRYSNQRPTLAVINTMAYADNDLDVF